MVGGRDQLNRGICSGPTRGPATTSTRKAPRNSRPTRNPTSGYLTEIDEPQLRHAFPRDSSYDRNVIPSGNRSEQLGHRFGQ